MPQNKKGVARAKLTSCALLMILLLLHSPLLLFDDVLQAGHTSTAPPYIPASTSLPSPARQRTPSEAPDSRAEGVWLSHFEETRDWEGK